VLRTIEADQMSAVDQPNPHPPKASVCARACTGVLVCIDLDVFRTHQRCFRCQFGRVWLGGPLSKSTVLGRLVHRRLAPTDEGAVVHRQLGNALEGLVTHLPRPVLCTWKYRAVKVNREAYGAHKADSWAHTLFPASRTSHSDLFCSSSATNAFPPA
jgi:hypothetical protein